MKTITIDLKWFAFPFILLAQSLTLVLYGMARILRLAYAAIFTLIMATGVGYLLLRALKGTGYIYCWSNPVWNYEHVKFQVSRFPRWAQWLAGSKSKTYTIVGGPRDFYDAETGFKVPNQKLMRGIYAIHKIDRPHEHGFTAKSSDVTVMPPAIHVMPAPVQPQPQPVAPQNPYQQLQYYPNQRLYDTVTIKSSPYAG